MMKTMTHLEDYACEVPGGWRRHVTVEMHGQKVRVRIYRDFYLSQSHAIVEIFSSTELKWNKLSDLPAEEWLADTKTRFNSYTDPSVDPYIATDAVTDELFAYASLVLA